jgi:hypothetical protein
MINGLQDIRLQDRNFAMTQFLHNLYFFVTTGIFGHRSFVT